MKNFKLIKLIYLFPIILLLGLWIFKKSYIGELFLSFFPQLLFILACLNLVFIVIAFRKKQNLLIKVFLLISFFLLIFNIYKTVNFYSYPPPNPASNKLRVLSANLLYLNKNYEEIKNLVNKNDPDVIVFVEYSSYQKQNIEDQIKQNYPFSLVDDSEIRQNVVFSKYPIKNPEIIKEPTRNRSYLKVEINSNNTDWSIYAVHTTPPISLDYFDLRNVYLEKLKEDVLLNKEKNIIIAGDFNVTPWSYYYQKFEGDLDGVVGNITKSGGVKYTWGSRIFKVMSAHIDHAFISKNLSLDSFELQNLKGSDHKALVFVVSK